MTDPVVRHLEVPRTARYAVLGEPGPETRELWIVLHGYRQLAPRFIRRFSAIACPERVIVAPEALNRFYVGDPVGRHGPESRVGATWMTREERDSEIGDYVGYLDLLHDRLQDMLPAPVPVVALGFSQGCHTVARWAAYGRARPGTVVLWGEVLPGDLDPARAARGLAGTRVVSVQGREDTHITPALLDDETRRLQALGVSAERRWHPLGHALEQELLGVLAAETGAACGDPGEGPSGG